jgi:hypothetical protein
MLNAHACNEKCSFEPQASSKNNPVLALASRCPQSRFRMHQVHEGVNMKLELSTSGIVLRKNQVLALDGASL